MPHLRQSVMRGTPQGQDYGPNNQEWTRTYGCAPADGRVNPLPKREKGDRHLFGSKTSMICHHKTCLSPFSLPTFVSITARALNVPTHVSDVEQRATMHLPLVLNMLNGGGLKSGPKRVFSPEVIRIIIIRGTTIQMEDITDRGECADVTEFRIAPCSFIFWVYLRGHLSAS